MNLFYGRGWLPFLQVFSLVWSIGFEIDFDPEHEPPETIIDGVIDIGELAAQFLALALDPYPRAPGVALDQVWSDGDEPTSSPFAAIEKLKRRDAS